jgi:hypothetical protein
LFTMKYTLKFNVTSINLYSTYHLALYSSAVASECVVNEMYDPRLGRQMIGDETKLRGLSPQANYADRATAAVGETVPTFAVRGVLRGQRNGSPRPLISVF